MISYLFLAHFEFSGLKSWGLNEVKVGVVNESLQEPEEWLFELIVGFGRDIIVLEVSLSVESNLSGLDLSVLGIDLFRKREKGI